MLISLNGYSQNVIDPYSLTSFSTISFKNANPLQSATSFIVKVKSSYYLITNNHVVGAEFAELEHKQYNNGLPVPKDSIPNLLEIRFYDSLVNTFKPYQLKLYNSNGSPKFIKFYIDDSNLGNYIGVGTR